MAKVGRKSPYNPKYHPKIVQLLAQLGKIDREISKEIGISEVTLNAWKKRYPEFLKSLKKGKKHTNDLVTCALLKRALGYNCVEKEVVRKDGKIIVEKIKERHIPSDTGAICWWQKNREPENWRDHQDITIDGTVFDMLKGVLSKKDKVINVEKNKEK